MNKKGKMGLAILFAVAYFMFGMITYQLLKTPIDEARTNLACATPPTFSGDKIVCLIIGGVIPFLVLTILSISAGIITEQATSK